MKRWSTKPLAALGPLTDGDWILKENYTTDGVRLIQVGDVGEGEFIGKSSRFISPKRAKELQCSLLQAGDILVSRMPDPLGRACVFPGLDCPAITAVDVAIFRPEPRHVNPRFIKYFLNSKPWFNEVLRYATGTTRPRISRSRLEQMEVPVPPLAEQERIVKLLDEADELRKLRAQADRRTGDLIPALFHEMFGDPVSDTLGWERAPLGTFLEFLTSGSRGWAKYYADSGAIFLRIQNIGDNELFADDLTYVRPPVNAEADRTKVRSGDVLLSITADLGRTAVVPEDFPPTFINQHLALLRLRKLDPGFVSATLSSASAKSKWLDLNRAAVKSGLNFDDIRSFPMIIPPLSLQNEFTQRVAEIRKLESCQAASRRRLDDLFQSMLHRAFDRGL